MLIDKLQIEIHEATRNAAVRGAAPEIVVMHPDTLKEIGDEMPKVVGADFGPGTKNISIFGLRVMRSEDAAMYEFVIK